MGVLIKYQEVKIVADGSEDHLNFWTVQGSVYQEGCFSTFRYFKRFVVLQVLAVFQCSTVREQPFTSLPSAERAWEQSLPWWELWTMSRMESLPTVAMSVLYGDWVHATHCKSMYKTLNSPLTLAWMCSCFGILRFKCLQTRFRSSLWSNFTHKCCINHQPQKQPWK